MLNEFKSGKYDEIVGEVNGIPVTQGDTYLINFGFVNRSGDTYGFEWVWWGILFSIGSAIAATFISLFFLTSTRFSSGKTLVEDQGDDEVVEMSESEKINIPFVKVDLTFKNIEYTVMSSITKEKLELLKGVDGVVESGKS
jgi:hypothetical protein